MKLRIQTLLAGIATFGMTLLMFWNDPLPFLCPSIAGLAGSLIYFSLMYPFQERKVSEERSSKEMEELTEYEKDFIERNKHCPDCETGDLMEGPHGGISVNYCCNDDNCGSRFNLTFFVDNELIFAERISDRSPKQKTASEEQKPT